MTRMLGAIVIHRIHRHAPWIHTLLRRAPQTCAGREQQDRSQFPLSGKFCDFGAIEEIRQWIWIAVGKRTTRAAWCDCHLLHLRKLLDRRNVKYRYWWFTAGSQFRYIYQDRVVLRTDSLLYYSTSFTEYWESASSYPKIWLNFQYISKIHA